MSTYLLPHSHPPELGSNSWHKNFSSTSHCNLWIVISTVPPPQSRTMTTFPFPSCVLTAFSESSLHWMEAPSGSRQRRRFVLLTESVSSAWKAAFLMNNLCSSLHKAGTVRTHRILAEVTFPTCSLNFAKACWLMKRRVCYITVKRGIYRPSIALAAVCMCNKCILYWLMAEIRFGIDRPSLHLRWFLRIFGWHWFRIPGTADLRQREWPLGFFGHRCHRMDWTLLFWFYRLDRAIWEQLRSCISELVPRCAGAEVDGDDMGEGTVFFE